MNDVARQNSVVVEQDIIMLEYAGHWILIFIVKVDAVKPERKFVLFFVRTLRWQAVRFPNYDVANVHTCYLQKEEFVDTTPSYLSLRDLDMPSRKQKTIRWKFESFRANLFNSIVFIQLCRL